MAGLIVHGGLRAGERVSITGAGGGVGHLALQLARARGATLVAEGEPCDLLFDTPGRAAGEATRIVTIAEEAPGADYFIVEPNGEQLAEPPASISDRRSIRSSHSKSSPPRSSGWPHAESTGRWCSMLQADKWPSRSL